MRYPWKLALVVASVVLAGSGCTTIVRSSSAPNGAAPNGDSRALDGPGLSDNGRYVAFNSTSSNLVPGDTNGAQDAFRRDNVTGTTIRVSVANNGSQISSASGAYTMSGSGDHVAFATDAALDPADTNGTTDVYVRSITAGTTERVSIKPDGSPVLNGEQFHSLGWAHLSDDGRYALVTDTQPNEGHAYLRDLVANTTIVLAELAAGAILAGDGEWIVENHLCTGGPCLNQASFVSRDATTREWISDGCGFLAMDVTADARYVVGRRFGVYPTFECAGATGLVRWDRVTKQALKIPLEQEPNPVSQNGFVRISNNGRFVALSDDLGVGRVIDLHTGVSQAINTDFLGRPVSEPMDPLSLSGNGRYVAFASREALTPEGANGSFQVFTRYAMTPSITGLTPSTVARGASHVTVQVRGKEFLPGPTVEFPAGVTVHSVTLVNPSWINVELSVAPTAPTGPAAVVVHNTGGFGSSRTWCPDCLTIT